MITAAALPVISGYEITMDEHGRYNLNALHRASGRDNHKRPSKWRANDQAKELIEELESQSPNSGLAPIHAVRGGINPGTFAVEELAIAYAAWIEPKFQLLVIRTFIEARTGRMAKQESLPCTLTHEHQRGLQKEINKRVYENVKSENRRKAFPAIHRYLKDRFGVTSYKDIAEKDYTQALDAVHAAPLEGVFIEYNKPQVPKDGIWLDNIAVNKIECLCAHFDAMRAIFYKYGMYDAFGKLGSRAGIEMIDHVKDGTAPSHYLQQLVAGHSRYDRPQIV